MEKDARKIIRIAITGPESTGKSSMAAELASHYNTVFVPEYAREYLEIRKGVYKERDIVEIAKGQIKSEKELEHSAKRILFCDTELLVIKLWSIHKFKKVDPEILRLIELSKYDHYLLCYPDINWVQDPLRENPELGHFFFSQFESALRELEVNFTIIKGNGNQRISRAIEVLDNILK